MEIRQMTKNLMLVSLLVAGSMSLVACNRKGGDDTASVRVASPRGEVTGSQVGGATEGFIEKCSNGASAVGQVYDQANLGTGFSFRSRVGDLVSATLNPENLGDVSGQPNQTTGVDFRLRLLSNAQGQVVSGTSRVQLVIYDSLVGQKDSQGNIYNPYPITITREATGTVNQATRRFNVIFSDEYGRIQVEGQWDQNAATGVVKFENSTSFDGSTPKSGILGAFAVPACALFN